MRAFWYISVVLSVIAIIVGIINATFSLVEIYMVLVAGAAPGTPIFLDELAPPLSVSVLSLAIALVICLAGLALRRFALRKVAS